MSWLLVRKLSLALACTVALARPCDAATGSASLTVNGTVVNSCVIASGPGIVFTGPYLGTALSVTSATVLSIRCTSGDVWTASLASGAGANDAGCVAGSHCLKNGATVLSYQLFTDGAGCSTVWNLVNTIGNTGSGAVQNIVACARIAAGQTAPAAAAFSDTITVTITY